MASAMARTTIHDEGIPDDRAWRAVLERDPLFEGRLLYAVRSTGVYCRPTCPSRRPGRPQVSFYRRPEEAERAGFRPCRRCRPREAVPALASLERARAFIEAHADEPLALARLAAESGWTPGHLQRRFTAAFGMSPKRYQNAVRAERFKAEVRRGRSVTDALYEAGFSSSSRLYEQAGRTLGMTPAAYRRGGAGEVIRYTLARCVVGRVLVAATTRGVCTVALGDDDETLEAGLRAEYPKARIERGDEALARWVEAVLAAIDASRPEPAVPLDLAGTPLQRRVWAALQEIPPGETRTYAELAAAVGRPRAVRAVAAACARNRVAVLIPCHRVVRSDGGLGGYRWGVARKKRLLKKEGARESS